MKTDAAATEHGEHFTKDEVSQIFKLYMDDMKRDLRPDQLNKSWTYYKSCAESKMKGEAGHTFVANAIWSIGLPRLPSFATKQGNKQLSAEDLKAIPEAILSVLTWLDRLASALKKHKDTKEYQDAVRKSGFAHGKSGLTDIEQERRRAIRKAKSDIRTAKNLARQWDNYTVTYETLQRWQEKLLQAHWDGSLEQHLKELSSQGSADPMCRPSSQLQQL